MGGGGGGNGFISKSLTFQTFLIYVRCYVNENSLTVSSPTYTTYLKSFLLEEFINMKLK